MSGGIGRVQGGFDEMVFRAMTRDDAHFYSNLGLVSEGTAIDFQVGANAYLYGASVITQSSLRKYLARTLRMPGMTGSYLKRSFRRKTCKKSGKSL